MSPQNRWDFSVNIPTLFTLIAAIFTAGVTYSNLQNSQRAFADWMTKQEAINSTMAVQLDRQTSVLTVWEERMKEFPLHRHVNGEIVYPEAGDAAGVYFSKPKAVRHER